MRRSVAWLLGGVAVFEFLKRRRGTHPEPARSEEGHDPRADELRRKLAESRAIVDEREEFEVAETPVDVVEPPPPLDPEERRRAVHESARAAAERMRERG